MVGIFGFFVARAVVGVVIVALAGGGRTRSGNAAFVDLGNSHVSRGLRSLVARTTHCRIALNGVEEEMEEEEVWW